MDDERKYNKWSDKTFRWLKDNSRVFHEVAAQFNAMGYDWMTPGSVAAPMAKEYHGWSDDIGRHVGWDHFALHHRIGGEPYVNNDIEWQFVAGWDLMDHLQGDIGRGLKAWFTTLKDLGPTKRQGANSIRTLTDYLENNPDDPLGLKQYIGHYDLLLQRTSGLPEFMQNDPTRPNYWTMEDTVRLNAQLWAWNEVQADKWFQKKCESDNEFRKYWEDIEPAERDALRGQYWTLGPAQMEAKYRENVKKNQGSYRPELGPDGSGGYDMYRNAKGVAAQLEGPHSDTAPDATRLAPLNPLPADFSKHPAGAPGPVKDTEPQAENNPPVERPSADNPAKLDSAPAAGPSISSDGPTDPGIDVGAAPPVEVSQDVAPPMPESLPYTDPGLDGGGPDGIEDAGTPVAPVASLLESSTQTPAPSLDSEVDNVRMVLLRLLAEEWRKRDSLPCTQRADMTGITGLHEAPVFPCFEPKVNVFSLSRV